jgi:hypothetical protein
MNGNDYRQTKAVPLPYFPLPVTLPTPAEPPRQQTASPKGLLSPRPSRLATLGAALQDAGAALDGRNGGHLQALVQSTPHVVERRPIPDPFPEAVEEPATDVVKLITRYAQYGLEPPIWLLAGAARRGGR